MITQLRKIMLTIIIFAFLSGCVFITNRAGFKAVSPALDPISPFKGPAKVDSTQPTFSWKGPETSPGTYDLILYKGIHGGRPSINLYSPGEEVYYKEGIEGPSHMVEIILDPQTIYVWAVRERTGETKGRWSLFNYWAIDGSGGKNLWWAFITP